MWTSLGTRNDPKWHLNLLLRASGRPWARNNPKRYEDLQLEASGQPWARNGSKRYQTHHLKHLGSLGSEMLQNNTKTNNLQPLNDTLRGLWHSRLFKRHLPQGLGLAKLFKRHPPRAFGPHTVRCANHPGRPRDETCFKQHPPNGNPTRRRVTQ